MPQRSLQFWEREGRATSFFDPLNIDQRFTHRVELLRKPIGRERVRQPRLTFVQNRKYDYKSCKTDCAIADMVNATVTLSGADETALKQLWTDIKANVDAAIAAGALQGVPANSGTNAFLIDVGLT